MKRTIIFIFLFVVCLAQISFVSGPSGDGDFNKKIFEYIQSHHNTLITELSSLGELIAAGKYSKAKDVFLQCRSRYKKTEAFVAYFFPGDAKFINGGNELEIEDDDEPNFIVYPHGLQVIEAALYSDQPDIKQLLNETDSVAVLLKNTTSAMQSMEINHRVFFEALQLQLIRLFMFTAVNMETPESNHAKEEMVSSFQGMKDLIFLAFPNNFEDKTRVLNVFTETLEAASQYLLSISTQGQIDYFKLYAEFYIPLSDQLRTARGNLTDGDYASTTAINLNAASVFEQSAFNTFFYNPTQTNTGSPERVLLGQKLFFDPVLSANNQRSCASCHRPEKAFTDGLPKSISMDGKTPVNRNAPTLINAAIQGRLFHDARTMNLETQADEVLGNPLEMHHDFSSSVAKLKSSLEYVDLFKSAFKGTPDTFISANTVLLAIAEYERTLVSFNSRFDKSVRGEENSLTDAEREGFQLFMTKGKCASCHFLPLFSGSLPPLYKISEWEVLGTPNVNDRAKAELDPDPGRAGVHRTTLYKNAFKTPGLRNVTLTAPYMHNGVFNTLEEVMDFYNVGGGIGWGIEVPNQSLDGDSLRLTPEESQKIIAFLGSLTDTAGLTSRPVSLPDFPSDPDLNGRKIGGSY